MLLFIAALVAADVVALAEVPQVKELCAALREMPASEDQNPAEAAAAHKAALARRDEALGRWYRTEIPSKGFVFGREPEVHALPPGRGTVRADATTR